jgi:murein DD-endopeptidase MepM/ murein hydrolase activator NlpD
MNLNRSRQWRAGRATLLVTLIALLLNACATAPVQSIPVASAEELMAPADEDDFSELIAQLRSDLNRQISRDVARKPSLAPTKKTAKARDKEFADKAKALFAPLSTIRMPIVGITASHLYDSWGDPREGGRRRHRGIDIFAARGTQVVAVTDGIISFIGEQPKGGHCIWLTTESGRSFYYAHLDRWAPGLYEGMEVQTGDLLGFVGNTGNALTTPPHLHFGINENDEMVNPYPVLTRAIPVKRAQVHVEVGGGFSTR